MASFASPKRATSAVASQVSPANSAAVGPGGVSGAGGSAGSAGGSAGALLSVGAGSGCSVDFFSQPVADTVDARAAAIDAVNTVWRRSRIVAAG
ncbi:hypothetical protein [Nannocystis pusilla]|uniref:hypothetical protein n=1 Tax=Nannocystis pusilla TaxID=889268 RepID=UPI003DA36625